jgi:uncharacterized protein YlxW (UPF0749 family)
MRKLLIILVFLVCSWCMGCKKCVPVDNVEKIRHRDKATIAILEKTLRDEAKKNEQLRGTIREYQKLLYDVIFDELTKQEKVEILKEINNK